VMGNGTSYLGRPLPIHMYLSIVSRFHDSHEFWFLNNFFKIEDFDVAPVRGGHQILWHNVFLDQDDNSQVLKFVDVIEVWVEVGVVVTDEDRESMGDRDFDPVPLFGEGTMKGEDGHVVDQSPDLDDEPFPTFDRLNPQHRVVARSNAKGLKPRGKFFGLFHDIPVTEVFYDASLCRIFNHFKAVSASIQVDPPPK